MLKSIFFSIVTGIIIIFGGYSLANNNYRDLRINVSFNELPRETQKQITCLADNIFFESAYEPEAGKKAVGLVTLNRVYSPGYPKTICEVVKQKTQTVCQFSWYCEERPNRLSYTKQLTPAQQRVYNEIVDLSLYVYLNYENIPDITKGALFFHADYVNPYWAKSKVETVKIGRHIFYTRKDMV